MEERKRFVQAVMEGKQTFNDSCQEFGISRKTGYKWVRRFEEGGTPGLADQSRRPNSAPRQLSETMVCELIKLKLAHSSWGPKKIRVLYAQINSETSPSMSSVNRIFKKAGLVKKRRTRKPYGARMTNNLRVEEPNDVWTIDFKGWWRTRANDRFEPFTVRDAYSRYVLEAKALTDTSTDSVQKAFIRLFKTYGMPLVIHSDNGAPFAAKSNVLGLSRLSAWLITLGINIHHSRPGQPQDNGGHERMHKDLKEEVQVRYTGDAKLFQAEMDAWRIEFNTLRPHEALGMKTPAEIYHPSERKYKGTPNTIDYPSDYQVRKVSASGKIKMKGQTYFITTALQRYTLGLKVLDGSRWAIYFTSVYLGWLDLKTVSFIPFQIETKDEK